MSSEEKMEEETAEKAEEETPIEEEQVIFKPRRSLLRSPTGHMRNNSWSSHTEKQKKIEEEKRRIEEENARKRPRTTCTKQETEIDEEDEEDIEESQKNIVHWAEQIKTAISKENNHKISVTKQDQKDVIDYTGKIKDETAKLVLRISRDKTYKQVLEERMTTLGRLMEMHRWQTEEYKRENEILKCTMEDQQQGILRILEELKDIKKQQIEQGLDIQYIKGKTQQGSGNIETGQESTILQRQQTLQVKEIPEIVTKTYAQIAKQPTKEKKKIEEQIPWETPPQEEKWETVVRRKRRSTEQQSGQEQTGLENEDNLKEIKKCLLQARIEGPLKGIWETKGGGVVIQCSSGLQRENIKQKRGL